MIRRLLPVLVLAALPSTAAAETLTAPDAGKRDCTARTADGRAGVDSTRTTASSTGWFTARLRGEGDGDWDLAVFDAGSGRLVAGSASGIAEEVAQGLVTDGQRLVVQACRLDRDASRNATVVTSTQAAPEVSNPVKASMVKVATPNPDRKRDLQRLGLDLTEHGGKGYVVAILYGAEDAAMLRDAKFSYTTLESDLGERSERDRRADRVFSQDVETSAFPSGRTTYRHLADYQTDMKNLAEQNPTLVRPIQLPFKTWTAGPSRGSRSRRTPPPTTASRSS